MSSQLNYSWAQFQLKIQIHLKLNWDSLTITVKPSTHLANRTNLFATCFSNNKHKLGKHQSQTPIPSKSAKVGDGFR